jgi:lipoprotein-releasing system permease protein
MSLPVKIALRFLRYSKGQTILIALGIAIGVSVQIFIGLLIQGLQTSLIDKTIGNTSHITVTAENGENFSGYNDIIDLLNEDYDLKAISASLDNAAFADVNGNNASLLIRGVTLDGADRIYKFSDALISGQLPTAAGEVIIGKTFSEKSGLSSGDTLTLFVPSLGEKTLTVSGVFDLKVSALNDSWLITDIVTASSVFETGDVAGSIEIQISDVFASSELAAEIGSSTYLQNYEVVDWQSKNEELLSGLSGQSISSIMIQIFVLVAVILGIASVLAISVLQKSKQIGILKAMGIKDSASSVIFLTQGFMLGLIGALIGILLGLGLIYAFTTFALNPDGSPLIPMTFNWGFISLSAGIAVIASMAASLIPAIRSMRMDPIEVIKNG